MKRLKFGIVGTNFISDWFVRALSMTDKAEPAAVFSRKDETGRAFADRHGIARVYTDYREMTESDIDAVYVASPTFTHESRARLAIENGKHVLCEKMLCASYGGALRIASAAKDAGVVLLEAMRPDFDPTTDVIRNALSEIGAVRYARLEYCQYSSRYDKFKSGVVLNAFDPHICNSALADIGIYPLHLAISLFGSPIDFTASALLLKNGFEGMGSISMRYESFLADVCYSKITDSVTPSIIVGEEGTLCFDRVNCPNEIRIIGKNGEVRELSFAKYEAYEDNMVHEIEAFVKMTEGKVDYRSYLDVTLKAVRIADEAYRRTGAIKYMNPEYMK